MFIYDSQYKALTSVTKLAVLAGASGDNYSIDGVPMYYPDQSNYAKTYDGINGGNAVNVTDAGYRCDYQRNQGRIALAPCHPERKRRISSY